MGSKTAIGWTGYQMPDGTITEGKTYNPWTGCSKISRGCARCYAETQNKRYNWNPDGWGQGKPRKQTSEAYRAKPLHWARDAKQKGIVYRVFGGSLMDPFDPEVPQEWRDRYWELIDATGGPLEWLLLTKRIENAKEMMPASWIKNPPPYVRLGVTAEDQENADKRIFDLMMTWRGKNFISVEPMLSPVNLHWIKGPKGEHYDFLSGANVYGYFPRPEPPPGWKVINGPSPEFGVLRTLRINWVIVGGESGAGCRPMNPAWAFDLLVQCRNSNIPYFFKQLGGFPDKQHLPEQWPLVLRVQEFPEYRPKTAV
jgi:protein gp37